MQSLLGHLSFFSSAFVGLGLFRRALDRWVAKHEGDEVAVLSDKARAELQLFEAALPSWANRPFTSLPFSDCQLITDASETDWGGMLVQQGVIILAAHQILPGHIVGTSSLVRELFALLEC